ncbi:MAG: HAD family phosphatase [Pseudomonadota bacterium]
MFDIGQVLIHYDPERPFKRLIPDAAKRAWFMENVCTSAWNIEQDRGRPWAEAEDLLIADHPDWETEIRGFRKHWNEMSYAYDDSVEILQSLLAAGHDVTFLTNFAADTFLDAQKKYPFLTLGRGVTVSGRVKLIKPNPVIYALHTETFELDPSATLFIDDSKPNVEAAREFGWQAIHFKGPEKLKTDLMDFNVPGVD